MYNKTCLNPLLHINALWHLWNIMYLKILWKMEHLLQRSKCSIFHDFFQKYSKLYLNFLNFSMLSRNRKMMSWSKNSIWSNGLRGHSKKANIGFQDWLLLNAGQKLCRMLPLEHSVMLLTFICLKDVCFVYFWVTILDRLTYTFLYLQFYL